MIVFNLEYDDNGYYKGDYIEVNYNCKNKSYPLYICFYKRSLNNISYYKQSEKKPIIIYYEFSYSSELIYLLVNFMNNSRKIKYDKISIS